MRLRFPFHRYAALLVLAALVVAPAWAKDDKKAAAGPLEVTYYYLPG
ncbi:MAG TPA: hypothetical protein VJV75_02965 [Candidatus Polarisedimenticolia bacterium]|nr:hypothetical protein [Candidatus Polarisedimenticolia bacterium]